MAASVIPKPGSKLGPCKRCEHIDCRELRTMADSSCTFCQKPIGYGVRYYQHDEFGGSYDHARCAEESVTNGN